MTSTPLRQATLSRSRRREPRSEPTPTTTHSEPKPRIVETKPAPTPAWRADPTALLIDPLDPDFAEPRPPQKDTSPQLSADELRRAGIGTLSTSATSALSALALAGERATDAAKGLRTAFANSKLARSTKPARSADDDEDD